MNVHTAPVVVSDPTGPVNLQSRGALVARALFGEGGRVGGKHAPGAFSLRFLEPELEGGGEDEAFPTGT